MLRLDRLGHDRGGHVLPRAVARLYARENVRREDGQEALVVATDGHHASSLQEKIAHVPPRGLHWQRLDGVDAAAGRVEERVGIDPDRALEEPPSGLEHPAAEIPV